MKAGEIDRCTCELAEIRTNHGRAIVEPAVVDPDCRVHGLRDTWPRGHPLQRHVRVVVKATGEAITRDEAQKRLDALEAADGWRPYWSHHFRDETPRETEARLYAESRGTG